MNLRPTRRLALASLLAATLAPSWAQQGPFRIGLILPMSGPFATTGQQIDAAVRLYMAQNGTTVAGRKIEVVLRDDAGVPDNTRRIAQELIANDKVAVLAGFGLTPLALSVAPLITQSKTPAVVMAAATSSIVESSPYFVRTSVTLAQTASTMAEWASRNGIRSVVTLVSDYGPGIDGEKAFKERFEGKGGKVLESLRVPLRNPDFAPFLQRVRDAKPEAAFLFVPSGAGAALIKQFAERGLDKAGIKLIGDGSVTDDDQLPTMSDATLGAVTAFHYSAAHKSALNQKFVQSFKAANKGLRPNFMAVGGWDGMRVIYKALEASKGEGGDALLAGMRGQSFESPRGPLQIDPATRDVIHNIYIRRVERVGGELYNVEIETFKDVKDPGKSQR
ncbi:MAG: amino acid/amide transporter substrate-binding protein family [Ramlibacter sp.]|jgi:branched-chain amino acid transport system substrate-binding protein|nr:amino acid/amide transporter substrate-binding protein family [Ramlibacter sp.]MDB5914030.1 amino acid/amide transporter substrate-binding protein family [Ramlibacter sp.]